MAQGSTPEINKGKVSVTFGWELMTKINAKARAENISYAKAVRRICWAYFAQLDEQH